MVQPNMDNPEKLANKTKTNKAKPQHNIWWTPLFTSASTNNVNKTSGLLQTK